MILRPLRDRVLIRPQPAATETASGLHLVEHWKPEQLGTVAAVGRPIHPDRQQALSLADRIGCAEEDVQECRCPYCEAAILLRRLTRHESVVHVGDLVAFGWNVGQEVWIDQERFFIMHETDLSAVIEPGEERP